ncbi:hypothetical protein Pint_25894 [Pistacia integerrima]|uniref:Uncharacterized protein n=1 Tax=Pistacia integerrima TaxID=434235 RepID=A0ACC0YEK8_9ROSI|nr:hypothetical protein Pint_25894 [Pistacia integerrima]
MWLAQELVELEGLPVARRGKEVRRAPLKWWTKYESGGIRSHVDTRCIFYRLLAIRGKPMSGRAFVFEHRGKKSKFLQIVKWRDTGMHGRRLKVVR